MAQPKEGMSSDLAATRDVLTKLKKSADSWKALGDESEILRISHAMVTSHMAEFLIIYNDRGIEDKPAAGFEVARIGALHHRFDQIEAIQAKTDVEFQASKKTKFDVAMETGLMLQNLGAGSSDTVASAQFPNGGAPPSTSNSGSSISSSADVSPLEGILPLPPPLPTPPSHPTLPMVLVAADHHLRRAIMRLKSLVDGQLKSICPLLRQRKLVASFELAGDTASYSVAVHKLALELLWSTSARTTELRKATVATSNEQHLINYIDYKISGIKTLLLLDYHILDQVFDFEEGDESVCISHVTFGMESGTLADETSGRMSQNGALE